MSDICGTGSNPGGKNKDCNGQKQKVTNFIIQRRSGDPFSPMAGMSYDDITDVTKWEAKFNSGELYRFSVLRGDAEKVGGDAVTIQNASNGVTSISRFNGLGFNAAIDTNDCDYNEMKRLFKPGSLFNVWEETNTTLEGWKLVSGEVELRGYTAEIVASPTNSAVADDNTEFMVMINYKNPKEKDYPYVIAKPEMFEFKAESAIPLGYSLEIIDKSTLTASIVLLKEKCGDVVTGVDGTAFFADGVALLTGDVTDNADGTYTLDLTGIKVLQVEEGTAPDISARSNALSV